ncbi:MAG: prepilin-type N-terminal cleavage/methylation domain-containing protein, partial [Actinomycetota bacterium]|nr:prepilin-type N-terminal cleavage/methylation domain-containing protein [Actinomycetota bacterium]
FTLIEVLVAFFLLMIGMAGTALMLNTANATTAGTKAREQGIALQREVVEAARSIPYDQLTPASVVSAVQAKPGLNTQSTGDSSWKIRRGGVTYTVTMGACSVDDPSDGTGAHDPASFCAAGTSSTTPQRCRQLLTLVGSGQALDAATSVTADVGNCGIDLNADGTVDNLVEASVGLCLLGCATTTPPDTMPDDYKRVVSLVTWDRGTGGRYALQSTTVPNPGSASGVSVTSLSRTNPPGTGQIGAGTTSVSFSAQTSRPAATVAWSVNGAKRESGTGSGTLWGWDWTLGTVGSGNEVLDGSYLVGAKAFDANGVSGVTRSTTVVLNRRMPYAPPNFLAGRNGDSVEFEWTSNAERDIEGYRVYQDGVTAPVCALTRARSCRQVPAPPKPLLGSDVSYRLVAVDKDPSGSLREGDPSSRTLASALLAPQPASGLTATTVDGATTLSWTASPSTDVEFYRIYRDGQSYDDRYDRVAKTERTYTDPRTDGSSHSYSITAVNGQLQESTMAGPVTR